MPGTIVFKIIDFEFVFEKLLNFEKFFARFDLLGAKQTVHLVRILTFAQYAEFMILNENVL